ncbi:MAG TPA: response regulator transcription factor [Thermoanaerobaculia bacterium]|jgi:two-component system KDP operon response regulator KdpE|nr:response regulator transcription factor [Thermoanaerobaculia bacterium]
MTRGTPLILVVDDDPSIRQTLSRELAVAGYDTVAAGDGLEGKARFEESRPDLVITDLAMPRADGLAVITAVRRIDRTPVIVLSVRGEEEDKVRALDRGADDYVTKPFSLRELLARVRTQLRRAEAEPAVEVLRFPGLEIDCARRTVVRDGQEVRLTPTELAILELLAGHAGRPVTLRQIIAKVWKGAPATTVDTVRVHVGSLRRKLEPDPANPRYIGTEPWVGYRFLAEPEG